MGDKEKKIRRLAPCALYDIKNMENWLDFMASRGLMLSEDGFFGDIVSFYKVEPQNVKYKLVPPSEEVSIWGVSQGKPDEDEIKQRAAEGWQYVARRGRFFVYRSMSEDTKNMYIDVKDEVNALKSIIKYDLLTMAMESIWIIIYLVIIIKEPFFLTLINMHTWVFLFYDFTFLWVMGGTFTALIDIKRLIKKLKTSTELANTTKWHKSSIKYHVQSTVNIVLCVICILYGIYGRLITHWDKGKMQIADYKGKPPFATMIDFSSKDDNSYKPSRTDWGFNTVTKWSDLIAPVNYRWLESAIVNKSDGTILDGGVIINYHETISPWIAENLAREYYKKDKDKNNINEEDYKAIKVDYVTTYNSDRYIPTILMQKGNKVIKGTFYNYKGENIDLDKWVQAFAKSIQ